MPLKGKVNYYISDSLISLKNTQEIIYNYNDNNILSNISYNLNRERIMNNGSIFKLNNKPHKGISKNNQNIEYKIIENYLIKGCFDDNNFKNPEYEKCEAEK